MSDLFMDMHRRRRRWHSHQNTLTPSTSSTTTTTTTSESPSSTRDVNDHTFSHHNKGSTADVEVAAHNVNNKISIQEEDKNDKHDDNNSKLDDYNDDDAFANILSLKLRKPKNWTWELSTSKSCSNISLPRILLYDHKGKLLADAHGDNEKVYRENDYANPNSDKSKKRSHQSKQRQSEHLQRSATTNLTHSIRKALEKEFNGLNIQEATPSPEPLSPISSHCSRKAIDFNTTDLPDYGLSRQSSSLRGVRFNVEENDNHPIYESQIPEFLPTAPSTTTTPTSSSSGPREKRKYRRSHSSGRSSAHSESILERFSYLKGRFSSPEYAEEKETQHPPRYFLRTAKAGTLVVKEDSFSLHPRRRRRRPFKNHSIESLQSIQKTPLSSSSPTQKQSASMSPLPCDSSSNSKQQQIENTQLSTSQEDVAVVGGQKPLTDNVNTRHLQRYAQTHNHTKDPNYSTDVHQDGKVR